VETSKKKRKARLLKKRFYISGNKHQSAKIHQWFVGKINGDKPGIADEFFHPLPIGVELNIA
jgi:hypothetical protein